MGRFFGFVYIVGLLGKKSKFIVDLNFFCNFDPKFCLNTCLKS